MIVAGIATIPSRATQLINTVESIYDQVDIINITYNQYEGYPIPYFGEKVINHFADGSDEQKFKNIFGDIYLSCDDDLIYPPDYVACVMAAMKQYPGCIITFHGSVYERFPVMSYYRDRRIKYRCLDDVASDAYVHVGGTGCMAFKPKEVPVKIKDFKYKFMADAQMAVFAASRGIPIVVIAHRAGWIRYQEVPFTIYDRYRYNDTLQTNIINNAFLKS